MASTTSGLTQTSGVASSQVTFSFYNVSSTPTTFSSSSTAPSATISTPPSATTSGSPNGDAGAGSDFSLGARIGVGIGAAILGVGIIWLLLRALRRRKEHRLQPALIQQEQTMPQTVQIKTSYTPV